jgi:hypothetical protein
VTGSDRLIAAAATLIISGMLCASVSAATPKAAAPYKLSVFVQAPAGLSAPDSIAVLGDHVFVGYGDNNAPDGSDGKSSQVVEYRLDGSIVHIFVVKGHNDGLKVDPETQKLWALQNEDANPRLVIIDPTTNKTTLYLFTEPTPHGGGYDDLVFLDGKVYISASNPAHLHPNTGPAIVSAVLKPGKVLVAPLLAGTAPAIDIPTDAKVRLNLQDPDSMTLDPFGDIVLDSQANQELIIVANPGTKQQQALRLPLSYETAKGQVRVETDDTAYATSYNGYILFADKGLNKVFVLVKKAFAPGAVYTAADGGPFVGTLDLTTGVVTPVVTGLNNPGGLVFVATSGGGSP